MPVIEESSALTSERVTALCQLSLADHVYYDYFNNPYGRQQFHLSVFGDDLTDDEQAEIESSPEEVFKDSTLHREDVVARSGIFAYKYKASTRIIAKHLNSKCMNIPLILRQYQDISDLHEQEKNSTVYHQESIKLPGTKLFVVYTGDKKWEGTISYEEVYAPKWKGTPPNPITILTEENSEGKVKEFIQFAKAANRFRKENPCSPKIALRKLLFWCEEHDILQDYLPRKTYLDEDTLLGYLMMDYDLANQIAAAYHSGMREQKKKDEDLLNGQDIETVLNKAIRGLFDLGYTPEKLAIDLELSPQRIQEALDAAPVV